MHGQNAAGKPAFYVVMGWKDEILKVAASTVLVVENVDDKTAAERMAICRACTPFFDPEQIRCKDCGCYLEVKTKCKTNRTPARPLGEVTHCPQGKWGDLETANFYRAQDGRDLLT